MTPEVDLASRWLGGSVIAASDESFGEKENLLTPSAAAFEPGRYGHRGEIVDGWETRRRREPGHDWALIRLGAPGQVTSVDVDTSFFTGNFPATCVAEGCGAEGYPAPAELGDPAADWAQLVPPSPLRGDAHNTFPVADPRRFTHIRLSIFPDGGVARLRVLGHAIPDPRGLERLTIDLASQEYGGAVVASSDDFYNSARLLNRLRRGRGLRLRRRRRAPGRVPGLAAAARAHPAAARHAARLAGQQPRPGRLGAHRRLSRRRAVPGARDRQHRPGGAQPGRLPLAQLAAGGPGGALPHRRRAGARPGR